MVGPAPDLFRDSVFPGMGASGQYYDGGIEGIAQIRA